jgi:hypothetical protein
MPRLAFSRRANPDKCFFQLLVPRLSPVSLLEREAGLAIANQLTHGHRKTTFVALVVDDSKWIRIALLLCARIKSGLLQKCRCSQGFRRPLFVTCRYSQPALVRPSSRASMPDMSRMDKASRFCRQDSLGARSDLTRNGSMPLDRRRR